MDKGINKGIMTELDCTAVPIIHNCVDYLLLIPMGPLDMVRNDSNGCID